VIVQGWQCVLGALIILPAPLSIKLSVLIVPAKVHLSRNRGIAADFDGTGKG